MPRIRLFAWVLLLLLLPVSASGEHAAYTARFTLGETLPKELAEFVDALTFRGEWHAEGDRFDLTADLTMYGAQSAAASVRLYGTEKIAALDASLIGDTTLMLNMPAAMEFALKAYHHFDVPLQNAVVWIPCVAKDAFACVREAWNDVFHKTEGPRTVSRAEVVDLAWTLYDLIYSDRALSYFLSGLDTQCGLTAEIDDLLSALPGFLEQTLPEEGVVIAKTDGGETWTAGGDVIVTREAGALRVRLPALAGRSLSIDGTAEDGGKTALDIAYFGEDGDIVNARFSADAAPASLSTPGDYAARLAVSGSAAGEGVDLTLRLTVAQDGAFTASLQNGGQTLIAAEGTLRAAAAVPLDVDEQTLIDKGINFFSLSDATLADFARSVRDPLLRGSLPILLRAPASFTAALAQTLLDSGAMEMIAPEGGKLPKLLRFIASPFGGGCLAAARACVLYPVPVAAGCAVLVALIVLGAKRRGARKRAARENAARTAQGEHVE